MSDQSVDDPVDAPAGGSERSEASERSRAARYIRRLAKIRNLEREP